MLFLILFNPPVSRRISFTILFSAIAVIDLLFHYPQTQRMLKRIRVPMKLLVLSFLYYFLICVVNALMRGEYSRTIFTDYVKSFGYFVCQISVSLFILRKAEEKAFTKKDIIAFFIVVGTWQSIIGIMCYVVPSIKSTLNSIMIRNSSEDFATVVQANSYRRNYGFASTLFDIFGFTMSVLSVMAFNRAFTKKSGKNYVYFILITIVAVLNARTSIVLIGAGVLLCMIAADIRKKDAMILLKKGGIILAVVICGIIMLRIMEKSSSATAAWLSEGVNQIKSFFQGDKTGIFETMGGEFIFFPDSIISTIFGTALSPMELLDRNTDMGYIQSIWRYGIIGSIINYSFLIALCRCAYKRKADNEEGMLVILMGVLIFVYQLKLNTWGYSMAGVVYYTVLMGIAMNDKSYGIKEGLLR